MSYTKKNITIKRYNKIPRYNTPIKIENQPFKKIILQLYYNQTNSDYCKKHNIGYCVVEQHNNQFNTQRVQYRIMNEIFRKFRFTTHIIYMGIDTFITDKYKSFNTLIDRAGDSDLILCRNINNKIEVSLNVFILRKSEWSLYKLRQFYFSKNITTSIILEQVYTNHKVHTLNSSINQLNKGFPFYLENICVYNEHAFNSPISSFIKCIDYPNLLPNYNVYPWISLPQHSCVKYRWNIDLDLDLYSKCLIPKIIFQTMETVLLPQEIHDTMKKWKNLNPEYKHVFFTSLDRKMFINKHFPKYVYKAYDILLPGAFKADLWRYCVLYIHGGIYADCRTIPLISLDQLIESTDCFIVPRDRVKNWLWNGFICSRPRHIILKKTIEHVCKMVHNREYGNNTLEICGPSCLGQNVNKYMYKNKYTSFYTGVYKKFNIKILNLSLFSHPIVKYGKKQFLQTKCKITDNQFSLFTGKERYTPAWMSGNIYKTYLI